MFKAFLDTFFPPHCHVCKTFIPDAGDLHLCNECSEGVHPASSPYCTVCGMPFKTENGIDHTCGHCIIEPPPFAIARAAALYDGVIPDLVHSFKYSFKVHLRLPLALLIVRHLSPSILAMEPDLIVPVPLHRKRLRERGFNQALLLAETISRRWKRPLSRHNLQRIRWTEPQINLPAAERATNVRGAFAVTEPRDLKGKKIVLVDDVYTTGSTVKECARVLKKEGAAEVYVVTVARAVS